MAGITVANSNTRPLCSVGLTRRMVEGEVGLVSLLLQGPVICGAFVGINGTREEMKASVYALLEKMLSNHSLKSAQFRSDIERLWYDTAILPLENEPMYTSFEFGFPNEDSAINSAIFAVRF